jgi:alpha-1,2-mannosyltransferase
MVAEAPDVISRPAASLRQHGSLAATRSAAGRAGKRTDRRLVMLAGAVLAVSLAGYLAVCAASRPGSMLSWYDLRVYQAAGQVAWHDPGHLYHWHYAPGIMFTYTPFAALVFAAAGWLPWPVLAWSMTAVSGLALLGTAWLTFGGLGWQGRRRAAAALAVTAAALWTEPVQRTLHLGQVELLLMGLIAWDLCGPPRRWRGAAIGLAAGIKLVPLIFVPYLLLTRRFRQAAIALAVFAAMAGAGFAVLPAAALQWWFGQSFLRPGRTGFIGFVANQSLRALLVRTAGSVAGSQVAWLAVAAAAGVAGLAAAALLHRSGRAVPGLLACALTGLLVSPVSWDHHWVWVVPALAVVADLALRARTRRRAWLWWALAAGVVAGYGAWPSLWHPGGSLTPSGLPWSAASTPGGVGSHPWDPEFHWQGLTWVAGNLYLLAGLALFAAVLLAAARCCSTTYRGSRAAATPARSTPAFAASPPPASSAALTSPAVRLRRASSAVTPPAIVITRAARSIRPPSPSR